MDPQSRQPLNVLLASVGTDGDIFPYVGLGGVLRACGHEVTLVASAGYAGLAQTQGLAFEALISEDENQELFGNPDFWHPLKTAPLSARWGVRFLERQYALLSTLAARENSVLVANPAVFAASLVHEKLRRPLVSLLLQPGLLPSTLAPPVMPYFNLPRWPKLAVGLFWRALDGVGHVLVGRHLNRLRASLGLPTRRRIFQTWLSDQLVLALFPDWFAAPQADWPLPLQQLGFPSFDGGLRSGLPAAIRDFCRLGPAPVACTFGTGMQHSKNLFRASLEACERLGVRAILLTRHRDQLPASLPASVLSCDFAPFKELFPLCAAVVHHGGMGTVAQALAAGTPQVVLPLAFDQMDNAARVGRLGVGVTVRTRPVQSGMLRDALARVMTEGVRAYCRIAADRLAREADPFPLAARLIEGLHPAHLAQPHSVPLRSGESEQGTRGSS